MRRRMRDSHEKVKMRDTRLRSWVKSILWRAMGIVLLFAIAWYLTEDIGETASITVIFHGIRVVLYYGFERLWERIRWGRNDG